MKPILSLLFFISLVSCAQNNRKVDMYEGMARMGDVYVGKKLAEFQGTTNEQITFNNKTLEGKVTFVNLWFKSCPPCIAEMDPLRRLYDRYKKDTNFVFLSLTYESPEVIKEMAVAHKMEYPVVSISRDECAKLNFGKGYPTNMVIDHTGTIQKFVAGGLKDPDEVQEFFNLIYSPGIREELRKLKKKK
jgi:peroxiredoxin